MSTTKERRRRPRAKQSTPGAVHIGVILPNGGMQAVKARLVDASDWGVGIETPAPLEVGAEVVFLGQVGGVPGLNGKKQARVVHCRLREEGSYRTGCEFDREESTKSQGQQKKAAPPATDTEIEDYYELLQISPNADTETIQRVYRMMAQRYHPDNSETGDEKIFQRVLHAYRLLVDPEKRAAYDVKHRAARSLRWKIFDQAKSVQGVEGEKRKRWGILSLLYTKMIEAPRQPGIMIRDLEDLLGCPAEHLEFTIWYLKQKGQVVGSDNGRYVITASGVDQIEEMSHSGSETPKPLLLPEAKIMAPAAN